MRAQLCSLTFCIAKCIKTPPNSGASVYLMQERMPRRYVFPAVGCAAVLTNCRSISDDVFLTAAEALAHLTSLEVRWSLL